MQNHSPLKNKQIECLVRALKNAGDRYSEILNIQVDEPRELIDIVFHDKNFFYRFKEAAHGLLETPLKDLQSQKIKAAIINVKTSIKGFLDYKNVDIKEWDDAILKCKNAQKIISNYISDYNNNEKDRIHNFVINEILVSINNISFLLSERNKELFTRKIALLYGEGGIGKTHLLCDYTKNNIKNRNIFLFLADDLPGKDPISAIANKFGFKEVDTFLTYLKKLKSQSEQVCIIIDAINENPNMEWKRLEKVANIYGVSIIMSVRSGYKKYTGIENWEIPTITHPGFSDSVQEWNAMTKYFQHYGLQDIAETPVLFNEFRNPLFLKIYCESYSGKKSQKRPRGNIMTNVFEQYVAIKTKLIGNDLGIQLNKKDIWNGVVKEVALFLGKQGNMSKISREEMIKILSKHEKISRKTDKIIELLCANGILREITHFNIETGIKDGLDYEFTYQKFSDHLIVRFYLNSIESSLKSLNKYSENNLLKAIKKGEFFKRALKEWNHGLIEALAIQVPERTRGIELCSIIPKDYLSSISLFKGVLNSIIWRDINSRVPCLDEQELNTYIKKSVYSTADHLPYLLNCLLTLATIPNHPFGSKKLCKIMMHNRMPKRDSFWQEYLYYHATIDHGTFNRLCSWVFSSFCDNSSDSQKYSSALALTWFLASTNQNIRDRATFAIIKLMDGRIKYILSLLKDFENCDDPYITERLYSIAYNATIYEKNQEVSFLKLVKYIDKVIFQNKNRIPNIMIEQHAKEIICLYKNRYQSLNKEIAKRCIPPYSYGISLRKRIPSTATIIKKYSGDCSINDCRSIINSVLYPKGSYTADFGNYTVSSALSNLSNIKLTVKLKEDCSYYYHSFIESLSHNQKEKLYDYQTKKSHSKDTIIPSPLINGNKSLKGNIIPASVSKADVTKSYNAFIASLNSAQKKLYKHISSYIIKNENPCKKYRKRKYNFEYAQRWIFQNVLDLGWSQELHGEFDNAVSKYNYFRRYNTAFKTERIGKKYQWISLLELMAIESSKYYICKDDSSESYPVVYQDLSTLNIRDFDPTIPYKLIVNENGFIEEHISDKFDHSLEFWWKPNLNIEDSQEWLFDKSSLVDIEDIIFRKKEGIRYTSLINWLTWTKRFNEKRTSELWLHLNSYIVRLKDTQLIQKWFNERTDPLVKIRLSLPFSHESIFLGEILKKTPVFNHIYENEALPSIRTGEIPFNYYTTVSEYSGESFDLSRFLKTKILMPSPFLRDFLKLSSKENLHFQNKKIDIFSPAVDEQTESHILVVSGNMNKKLIDGGYTILWTLIGEKQGIGDVGNFHDGLKLEGIAFFDENGQLHKAEHINTTPEHQKGIRKRQ